MASIPTMPPPKIIFSRFGYIGKKPLYAVDTPENLGTAFAKFKCTFEDFKNIYIEHNNNENSKAMIEKQLKNRVKKCPKCLKSCGETMVQCNGCGHDIRQIECSYTPNVFTLFICSVEKFNSNRPLSISLRYESEEFIVMDDLNAMSLCHMLIVPTNFYVPDVRHLYKHPKEGLKLVNRMVSLGIKIFQTQFLSKNDEVIIPKHSFLMYEIYASINNAKIKYSNVNDYSFIVDDIIKKVTNKTKIIFIAQPNNPTGIYLDRKNLSKLLKKIPKRIMVVIILFYLLDIILYPRADFCLREYQRLYMEELFRFHIHKPFVRPYLP